MPLDPRQTQSGLEMPGGRHTLRLLGRALRLRCPHCGGAHVMATWFRVKPHCPACGIRFERGESDYFVGSMMFNLVLSEGVFAIGFVAVLLATWPDVPWRTLEIAGPMLMLAAPFVLFPLSKTVWLAFDLLLRPPSEEELRWHRDSHGQPAAGRR